MWIGLSCEGGGLSVWLTDGTVRFFRSLSRYWDFTSGVKIWSWENVKFLKNVVFVGVIAARLQASGTIGRSWRRIPFLATFSRFGVLDSSEFEPDEFLDSEPPCLAGVRDGGTAGTVWWICICSYQSKRRRFN